jgi:hypothetical protein
VSPGEERNNRPFHLQFSALFVESVDLEELDDDDDDDYDDDEADEVLDESETVYRELPRWDFHEKVN